MKRKPQQMKRLEIDNKNLRIREYVESDNELCMKLINDSSGKNLIKFTKIVDSYKEICQQFITYSIFVLEKIHKPNKVPSETTQLQQSKNDLLGVITVGYETVYIQNQEVFAGIIADLHVKATEPDNIYFYQYELLRIAEIKAKEMKCDCLICWVEQTKEFLTKILKDHKYICAGLANKKVFLTFEKQYIHPQVNNMTFRKSEAPESTLPHLNEYYKEVDLKLKNMDNLTLPIYNEGWFILENDKKDFIIGASVWSNPIKQRCDQFFLHSKLLKHKLIFPLIVTSMILTMGLFIYLAFTLTSEGYLKYIYLGVIVICYSIVAFFLSYLIKYVNKFIGKEMKNGKLFGYFISIPEDLKKPLKRQDEEAILKLKVACEKFISHLKDYFTQKNFFSLTFYIPEDEDGKYYIDSNNEPFVHASFIKVLNFKKIGSLQYFTNRFFIDPRILTHN